MRLSTDFKLRLFGPLALFVFGALFFRLKIYLTAPADKLMQLALISICCGYLGWEVGRWGTLRLQNRYPGLAFTNRRLFILFFWVLVLANLNSTIRIVLNYVLQVGIYQVNVFDYIETTGIQIVYASVYVGIYEGRYLVNQWQQTYTEKELLLKTEWQARFDSLKSQVNPHFLFNALNALSALIEESPAQASEFVDELSKVYRYLLQANDRELTTLKNELHFIESYAHLLRMRHGSGIRVHVDVPESFQGYSLPPLSLQLLVENAVKHNIVLASRPLHIEIKTAGPMQATGQQPQLMVRNNLQRKNGQVLSNGVGLNNIVAKYQMLTEADIIVQNEGGYFTVLLPLLIRDPAVI